MLKIHAAHVCWFHIPLKESRCLNPPPQSAPSYQRSYSDTWRPTAVPETTPNLARQFLFLFILIFRLFSYLKRNRWKPLVTVSCEKTETTLCFFLYNTFIMNIIRSNKQPYLNSFSSSNTITLRWCGLYVKDGCHLQDAKNKTYKQNWKYIIHLKKTKLKRRVPCWK